MNTCVCGNPANDNGTTCQRCDALHELGLKAGATDAEVKTAYRLYVKAWHPDRFPGDEKSIKAAQEKLKSINSAYGFLTSPSSKRSKPYSPRASTQPAQAQEPSQEKETSAKPQPSGGRSQEPPPNPNNGGQAPPRPPNSPPPPPYGTPRSTQTQSWPNQRPAAPFPMRRPEWTYSPKIKTFLRYAAIICALSIGKAFWQTFDAKPTTNTPAQAQWADQRDKAVGKLEGQMPSSADKANPQSGSDYDLGRKSYRRKDYVGARVLFTQACDAGEMKACNYLGYLFARGLGGDQDRDKARDVYQKACDKGTLSSCASLGSLYQDVGNSDEARNYFQKACNGGLTESCDLLRNMK